VVWRQVVRITGAGSDARLSWGSGGFTVQQFGALSLTGLTISGDVIVKSGGALHLSQVRLL
jgi:hypothetical protein